MKRKIILSGALILLLAVILFMAWDMFLNKPNAGVNPYQYDLKSFKTADTSLIRYVEVQQIIPGLDSLHGIATDRSDRIFICAENGVEIFDHNGRVESEFAVQGTANCLFADTNDHIYLGMQDHVEIFTRTGTQLMKWKSCGNDAIITSIAVRGMDAFLADAGNKVVYQYDLKGNILKKIGIKDPARNIPGFVVPSPYFDLGIGIDRALWVVNPGRHHFEKYNQDGDLISQWGKSSMAMEGFCGCCNPSNFAILPDGSFVTSEKGIERVKVIGPDGAFKCVVAGASSFIEGTKGLDIAVNSVGNILVLDPEKNMIRIFALKKTQP